MITKQQILAVRRAIDAYPSPVLTLYAHVNPAHPGNTPKAIALRARAALRRLDAPAPIVGKVLERLETGPHRARTLALFASDGRMDELELELDLPMVDGVEGHFEARWGEPYLSPLLLALDEYERYGVAYVDRDRWRLFEIFLGEIAEVSNAFRPIAPAELDRLQRSKNIHPAYIADRAGAARDLADRHLVEWTARFFRDGAHQLEAMVRTREIDRVILMGPDEDTRMFETALARPLRARVIARLPSLPHPAASADEVLRRVADTVEAAEARREAELLDKIREEGMWRLDRCLPALQRGQLHALAVPWRLDRSVFSERSTGYVAATPDAARAAAPDGAVDEVPLRDVLPELASAFAARIEFMRGPSLDRLIEEFGGMGALRRW
jgi:peptide subunit release factor 1 (eRF1)